MGDHAKLSPSARHRWAACPGSVREEARYPEPPSGPAAVEGTHTHTLLEYCVKSAALAGPMHMVGHTMKDHEGEFRVTQDQAKRVELAMDYIRSRVKDHTQYEVISETRVNPEFLTGRDDLHGTVDVQIWAGDVYEIIDYKDGMNPVPVVRNPQLVQYALGVLSRFKLTPFDEFPFKTFRFTIIQPKLALKGMEPITSWEAPVSELLAQVPVIVAEAKATEDPDAPLIPGEAQCKYCKHKGSCSALAGNVMEKIGMMFQPVSGPQPEVPSFLSAPAVPVTAEVLPPLPDLATQSANKDPMSMTPEQLQQALEAVPLLRQFIDGIEKEALRRMEAGQTIPGFKLVRGRGSRKWALPDEEMVEVLKKMCVPKNAIFKAEVVSPAKVKDLTWTKKVKGEEVKATLGEKQLKRLEAEYITYSAGKPTIAPLSDSREAIVTNVAPMFQAIETPVQPAVALPDWLQ